MEVSVEKLVYGGDGLARIQTPGEVRRRTLFLPFVLEGERVEATVVEEKSSYLRGKLQKVLEASPNRSQPPCPHFMACGGCHYQHSGYQHQLELKTGILRETLRRTARIAWEGEIALHPSPPWGYRNRVRMKMNDAPFSLGYFGVNSHDMVPVDSCPLASPLINRAILALWQAGSAGRSASGIRDVEIFADSEDKNLLLELFWDPDSSAVGAASATAFAEDVRSRMAEITGAAIFLQRGSFGLGMVGPEPDKVLGHDEMIYTTRQAVYQVSAGAFFQSNRFLIDELVDIVAAGRSGALALELYAGVGLFAVPLARNFRQVVAVEAAPYSHKDLVANAPRSLRAVQSTTEEFLKKGHLEGRPDLIVLDPPRAGLGEEVAAQVGRLDAPSIVYVSCDPATLARDLRVLLESGYRIERAHLIDLFPQTFHIESVFELVR